MKKKYAVPRRTEILYDYQADEDQGEEDETPDYPVNLFLSQEGYFKKITPQSLRMASDQKYKEGDGPWLSWEGTNRDELLVFTDKQQCYKTRMSDFDDSKPVFWGTTCPPSWPWTRRSGWCGPASPGTTPGSCCLSLPTARLARVELAAYQTQTRRKKLTGALLRQGAPGGGLPGAGGLRAGGVLQRRPVHGVPHRPPGPQDHPHHPGGQR